MDAPRESRLVEAFVELADTLVNDFDVVEFLHLLTLRVTDFLSAAEAGLVLADPAGRLYVMASSTERSRALELFELQNEEGPCFDCYRDGVSVTAEDLAAADGRWPRFAPEARAAGFASVHALALRLRNEVIGALNIFGAVPGRLSDADHKAVQGMADIATIGILQQRAVQHERTSVDHLQGALNSRIVVEQAKGVLAERAGLDMAEAFSRLRHYARNHNRRLSDVAGELIDGTIDAEALRST